METEEKKKIIEEITNELLEKMDIQASVFIATNALSEDNTLSVEIQSDDSSFLIGKYGVNLAAFQHMCRILVRKRSNEIINFTVDVNNYRQKQGQKVTEISQKAIEKVLSDGNPITLEPMNAYERRLVHMEASKHDSIRTESIGEDEERRVVIKPAE